jgi:flagellar biosynthesis/type III secretory pathway chaperone
MTASPAKPLMQDILAGLARLHELLRHETAAITGGKDDAILEIAAEKQAAIGRLMDCAPRIQQLLVQQGLRPDAEGLAAFVHAPGSGDLLELHERVVELLNTCRIHNQTNGLVLERKRAGLERALRVLFDQQAAPERYAATGRLDGFSPRRSIGEA